jgi:hypothetical protein
VSDVDQGYVNMYENHYLHHASYYTFSVPLGVTHPVRYKRLFNDKNPKTSIMIEHMDVTNVLMYHHNATDITVIKFANFPFPCPFFCMMPVMSLMEN